MHRAVEFPFACFAELLRVTWSTSGVLLALLVVFQLLLREIYFVRRRMDSYTPSTSVTLLYVKLLVCCNRGTLGVATAALFCTNALSSSFLIAMACVRIPRPI